ncbi:glycerol-3-phosphate acyltransferase, partial [bacterium]
MLRRATYLLLRRIERERRVVTGPIRKPVDRVRAEVIRSPKLQKLLGEMADIDDPARAMLTDKVDRMLQEMEATPEPAAVPLLDKLFERTVRRMYQDILVDEAGLDRLREVSKDGTLVLLPNHRSHVDYIILSKIFHDAKMPVPLVAAGDNLNFFPAGPILRRAGAFYLRRSFRGDRLYAAVLEAYVRRLIREGHPLEFFLEGGRSRTGRLLPAKRGLLSMVVDSALGGGRPVYFCPIAIVYERVPEEHAYVRELTGASKEREDARGLFRSARVLGQNYGHLSIELAEPISLDDLVQEFASAPESGEGEVPTLTPAKRRALVTTLANRTMTALSETFAVTPGAIVATVLLALPVRALAHDELLRAATDLLDDLRAQGARFARPLAVGEPT